MFNFGSKNKKITKEDTLAKLRAEEEEYERQRQMHIEQMKKIEEEAKKERLRRQQEFEEEMRRKDEEMKILDQKAELNKKLHEIKMEEDKLKFEKNMNIITQKHLEEIDNLERKKNLELFRIEQIRKDNQLKSEKLHEDHKKK